MSSCNVDRYKEFTYAAILLFMVFLEGHKTFVFLKTLIAGCFKSKVSVFFLLQFFVCCRGVAIYLDVVVKLSGADCDVRKFYRLVKRSCLRINFAFFHFGKYEFIQMEFCFGDFLLWNFFMH